MKHPADFYRQWPEQIKKLLQDEKKRVNLLVCAGLGGLLLLGFSEWLPQETAEPSSPSAAQASAPEDYARQLETRLQELITRVEGAGAVEVMVTLECGEENVYATDQQTGTDGTTSVDHVLLGDSGLMETVQTPRVQGVAVVCEGGGDAAVQNRVSTLVEVLTGVGANHITVAKMAATE